MTLLAINDQLGSFRTALLVAFVDLALQTQDDGAGRIHDGDLVLSRQRIGRGRLTMGTQQHLCPFQRGESGMVNRLQAFAFQTFHLQSIVHDVTQAIERMGVVQLPFRTLDGIHHPEAKP